MEAVVMVVTAAEEAVDSVEDAVDGAAEVVDPGRRTPGHNKEAMATVQVLMMAGVFIRTIRN